MTWIISVWKKLIHTFGIGWLAVAMTYCSTIDYHMPRYHPGNIYLAGAKRYGSDSIFTATYWKNGIATPLTDGKTNSALFGIQVTGNDIYTVGYEGSILKYWKNKNAVTIADTITATSMAILNEKVYLAGEAQFGATSVPAYWSIGQLNHLLDNSSQSASGLASAIADASPDFFIAGYQTNKALPNSFIWKNGKTVVYQFSGIARAVTVHGTDVYAAGSYSAQGTDLRASYWKNGTRIDLTAGTTPACAYAITVSGDVVYVAGYETNAKGFKVAKYWKNGEAVSLTEGNSYSNQAYAIAVYDNDVYVTCDGPIAHSSLLCKNGKVVAPFDGTSDQFYALGLFIY